MYFAFGRRPSGVKAEGFGTRMLPHVAPEARPRPIALAQIVHKADCVITCEGAERSGAEAVPVGLRRPAPGAKNGSRTSEFVIVEAISLQARNLQTL